MPKRLLLIAIFLIILGGIFYSYRQYSALRAIDSYEECVMSAGSQIQTSYPPACLTYLGKRFTQENISSSPSPRATVTPPPLPRVDTTGWQTYTHKAMSFTLQYPPDFYPNKDVVQETNLISLTNGKGYYLTLKIDKRDGYESWIEKIMQKAWENEPTSVTRSLSGHTAYFESRQSSGPLFERNVIIDDTYAVIHLNVAGDETVISSVYAQVETLADEIASTFRSIPLTFQSADDSLLPENTYDFCGPLQPKTKFSVTPPAGWTMTHARGTNQYLIKNPATEQYLDIRCGNGFGGGCEEQGIPLKVINQTISTCTVLDKSTGLFDIRVAYFHPETKEPTAGEYINAFSLTGKIEETYLNQILNSFRFLY